MILPRAIAAHASNGASAAASFAVSVAIARRVPAAEFGDFAVAMILFVVVTGIIRAAITDTALASPDDASARGRCARRSHLTSLMAALGVLAWGLVSGNIYCLILAAALPGLSALDFVRTIDLAILNPHIAAAYSLGWLAPTIVVCGIALAQPISPLLVYAAWALAGNVVAAVGIVHSGLPWRPGWPTAPRETRAAGTFAVDYLIGSGGANVTTALLGTVFSPVVIGAIRGAGTLFGPVTLIAATARSLVLPMLARSEQNRVVQSVFWRAVGIAATASGTALPLVVGIVLLPDTWGEALLGASWDTASAVLLPLGIEALLAFISNVPAAGHRALLASRRTLGLRLAVGVPRPLVVIAFADAYGAVGAAWAMVALAAVNAVLWWASYANLLKKH